MNVPVPTLQIVPPPGWCHRIGNAKCLPDLAQDIIQAALAEGEVLSIAVERGDKGGFLWTNHHLTGDTAATLSRQVLQYDAQAQIFAVGPARRVLPVDRKVRLRIWDLFAFRIVDGLLEVYLIAKVEQSGSLR